MEFVLDVKEKDVSNVKAPSVPSMASGTTGFPEHKKRNRPSAFKQQRQSVAKARPAGDDTVTKREDPAVGERRKIDLENTARLDSMSQEEIEEAQKDLLQALDPSIVQMLLKRANLDDGRNRHKDPFAAGETAPEANESAKAGHQAPPIISVEYTTATPLPAGTEPPTDNSTEPPKKKKVTFDDDAAPELTADLFTRGQRVSENPAHTHDHNHDSRAMHFPAAPSAPDLDPSDPDFLASLHEKYFPNLPADPAKLAWMAPIPTPDSAADLDSPYHPDQSTLSASDLRFDFRANLIPPRLARQISPAAGLHHHAEAPEAAGYTIPELARLARSAVPAQRCIAFQTLGRLLYRLGKGGYRRGKEDEIEIGIWSLVRAGYVLETLEEAAGVEEGLGHRAARAYAIEALWMFQQGGWKEKWKGQ